MDFFEEKKTKTPEKASSHTRTNIYNSIRITMYHKTLAKHQHFGRAKLHFFY